MRAPLVTVIILSYNQEQFINDAIDSVLAQDYSNLQIVIADDCSTDHTKAIIESYAKKDQRIIAVFSDSNQGITPNTISALKEIQGEFVAFMGGDDILLPGKIRQQVEYMQRYTDVTISYHDLDVFDSDTKKTLYFWSERYGKKEGDVKTIIAYGTYMGAVSIMVRSTCLAELEISLNIQMVNDWYMWVYALTKGGRIGYINAVLARYRRHPGNVTSNWQEKIDDQYRVLMEIEKDWPEYRLYARRRKGEIKFIELILVLKEKKYRQGFLLFLQASFQAFPYVFPWVRLIVREVKFLVLQRKREDLLQSLFGKNAKN